MKLAAANCQSSTNTLLSTYCVRCCWCWGNSAGCHSNGLCSLGAGVLVAGRQAGTEMKTCDRPCGKRYEKTKPSEVAKTRGGGREGHLCAAIEVLPRRYLLGMDAQKLPGMWRRGSRILSRENYPALRQAWWSDEQKVRSGQNFMSQRWGGW